jgi:isopenicillin N synthase-like dioxygenase
LPIQPVSFDLHERDFARFADALGRSFERYGFAVVEGHRIDPALVARAERATRAFFALPDPVKSRYRLAGVAGQRGYVPFGVETAKGAAHPDLKEFWHVGREGPPRLANVWPEEIADFRPAVAALYGAFDELGAALLAGVAHHLGLPRDHFSEAVADGESIRAGAHEDINAITLLLGAEEAGLELLDRDGRWLAVNPEPGAVVVNIGDMLQRLTNHRLPSTTHRVVNPAPERRGVGRYSMPFFLHFRPDYLIRTLEGCVGAETPDRYPEPITASAYLAERLREIRLA